MDKQPYSSNLRSRMVKRILAGERERDLAKEVGIPRTTLITWRRAYDQRGPNGLRPKKRRRQTTVFTEKHREIIQKIVTKKPQDFGIKEEEWTITDIKETLYRETGDWLNGWLLFKSLKKIGFTLK